MSIPILTSTIGISARCNSGVTAVNRQLLTQLGINIGNICEPCVDPVGIPGCCFNCFQIVFPGFTCLSATVFAQTFRLVDSYGTGNYYSPGAGSSSSGTFIGCIWEADNSNALLSSAILAWIPGTTNATLYIFPTSTTLTPNLALPYVTYSSTNFSCTGGKFTNPQGTNFSSICVSPTFPATLTATATNCGPIASSSSSSSSTPSSSSSASSSVSSSVSSSSSSSSSHASSSSVSSSSSSGCSLAIGQTATKSASGIGSAYTVGFGTPSVSGTWIVAIIWDESESSVSITGGSTWTQAAGFSTSIPGMSLFYKKAGASEPSSYTVSYAGGTKTESNCVSLLEVTGGASGMTSISFATNTDSPSSVTYLAGNYIILGISGQMTVLGAPTGFTMAGNAMATGAPAGSAALAYLQVGVSNTSGFGNWSITSNTTTVLWSLVFAC